VGSEGNAWVYGVHTILSEGFGDTSCSDGSYLERELDTLRTDCYVRRLIAGGRDGSMLRR